MSERIMTVQSTPYDVLREHEFTRGLTDSQLAKLASLCSEVAFQDDDVILMNGQRSEYFYLILSGSACVELRAARFTVCLQALGAGQAFGWSALLDHQDTLFQVRAREPMTALCLHGSDLAQLRRTDPELGAEILLRILGVVASRVKATEERFAEMCGVSMNPNRTNIRC
jgi:CRP/FNR family cyclic AMP-dependent transcriptional regulator